MKSAADADVKGLVKNKAKLLRPKGLVNKALKGSSKVLGKLSGPAFAAYDAYDSYKGYRKKGHGKTGSAVRGAVKAGSYWGGFSKGAAAGVALTAAIPVPGARIVGGAVGGLIGGATASKASDMAINAYDKVFKPKAKLDKKYQDPKYVAGVVQKKKDKKPVSGLSLGVSDKQWKARFGEEYVQERNLSEKYVSKLKQRYLAKQAAEDETNRQAAEIEKENPGALKKSFSGALLNKNTSNNTPVKTQNTQTTQKPVVKSNNNNNTSSSGSSTGSSGGLTTLSGRPSRLSGRAQQAVLNMKKDANDAGVKPNEGPSTVSKVNSTGTAQKVNNQSSSAPNGSGGRRKVDGRALMDKLRAGSGDRVQSGGGSTPPVRPVPQAGSTPPVRPVPQAGSTPPVRPVPQAAPQRTVGGQGNRQRPVKTGGIQLGNAVRKPIGSAINAVRSALSNKGPIQGRQTGAQRRAAQTANRPVTQAPIAVKPAAPQASVAKPVQAAPVAKPAPQLSGAQRAQQMAKQRIAQGRSTLTGALKSAAKPKPKVTTWRDLE